MDIALVPASPDHVSDYIRIGNLNTSKFNAVTTDPANVLKELQTSTVYMVEVDGKVVGFVSYEWKAINHAYISEVQVEPNFRGKGIGGAALEKLLKELRTAKIVDLHTHPENPAQKLYMRHGFQPTGEVIENYHNSGEPRMRMVLQKNTD